ncbi:S66 peptidase family protein [Reinekea sp. G2M2-21]|uniref:S66 family peptidase n=1 Tax=Reinekea sp. G2M2-21 TaxID=2788942 RepID=UPI0018ABA37C|nr:S66 peptidase family protein [Reinekea sp. G2M2-21]
MTGVRPPKLQPGDTLAFYSPSSPATAFAPNRTRRAVKFLESKGYRVVAGDLTGHNDHYRSGSIQARADELNALIRNPDVRCIMSTIGGANSSSLLPYIDYEAIRKDPKIFIGYSDVTAILLGIYAQTGLTTFYGPALTASFGELPPLVDDTFASFQSLTHVIQPSVTYSPPSHWSEEFVDWETQDRPKSLLVNQWQWLGEGTHCGRLIGGNLNTMSAIWGSPYMPSIKQGDVLLIEDSLKDIATVERLFALLKINGVFDKVSAVLLGKHELFKDGGTGRTPLTVLQEVLAGQPLPIVNGFDSCHTHPMLTVPIGCQVEVCFDTQRVSLKEPAVQ